MRILFVNGKCGFFGGVEQNIADTARALRGRGHTCHLVFGVETDRDPEGYRERFDECFPVLELGGLGKESFVPLVRRLRPDVIYFHKVPRLSLWLPLEGEFRAVRMVHDHDVYCPRRHKYFLWNGRVCHQPAGWRCALDMAFIERTPGSATGFSWQSLGQHFQDLRLHRRLDAVLVGSRYMATQLLENGLAPERVHVLPPVVPSPATAPSTPNRSRTILYAGQLVRGKGVDLLLDALSRLRCDFSAVIVGTGNARAALERQLRQRGLQERVKLEGWVSPHAMPRYYREAALVVVPSRWPEPFGMVGLEAMGNGRPVVAYDVGGIRDWLEDGVNGLLVPEQDVDALASAIGDLLDHPARAEEMGLRGYARARERFSFEAYVRNLEAILQEVPGQPRVADGPRVAALEAP